MPEPLAFFDLFLFVVLPYVAAVVATAGTIERYRRHAYSCSSHSSQFLENRSHFWGEMAFHYGIILTLFGHLIMVMVPASVLGLATSPPRLFTVEAVAVALGLLAGLGLLIIIARRVLTPAVRRITRVMDWLVYALLLTQIASGLTLAIALPWGPWWFASILTPYLWSLARLQPDASAVAAMPLLLKLHVATAFSLVAVFPFSRLVHIVAVPNSYLWRPRQVVRWRRRRAV